MKMMKVVNEYSQYLIGIKGVRASSEASYRMKLLKFLRTIENGELRNENDKRQDAASTMDMPKVTQEDVARYMAGLVGKVGINTRRMTVTVLRDFFKWYSGKYGGGNPARNLVPIREYIKHPDVLRLEEVEKIILAAGKDAFFQVRNAAIVCVLADTGIRVSELCELRIKDISQEDEQFIMTVPATKGNRSRMLPFCFMKEGSIVAEYFSFYYAMVRYKKGWMPDDYLFQRDMFYWRKVEGGWVEGAARNYLPGPLSRRTVLDIVKRLAREAGVERKVSPHSFRHFYATYLAVTGTDPIKIQQRLGHSSLDRTMIYVHYADIVKSDSAKNNPLSKIGAGWKGAVETLKMAKRFKG